MWSGRPRPPLCGRRSANCPPSGLLRLLLLFACVAWWPLSALGCTTVLVGSQGVCVGCAAGDAQQRLHRLRPPPLRRPRGLALARQRLPHLAMQVRLSSLRGGCAGVDVFHRPPRRGGAAGSLQRLCGHRAHPAGAAHVQLRGGLVPPGQRVGAGHGRVHLHLPLRRIRTPAGRCAVRRHRAHAHRHGAMPHCAGARCR